METIHFFSKKKLELKRTNIKYLREKTLCNANEKDF